MGEGRDIFKGFENKGNIIVLQLFMQQWFIGQRSYGGLFFCFFYIYNISLHLFIRLLSSPLPGTSAWYAPSLTEKRRIRMKVE